MCLGARKLGDGEPIGLVPVGDVAELTWTLGGDGSLYAGNGTLRLGSSAASGDAVELRDAKDDKSSWHLEEVKNYA